MKPWVEVLNPLQQLIRMHGNFILCPGSHLDRLGKVPGICSSDPSLLGPLPRLLVSVPIHQCATLQPGRPLRCELSCQIPMIHPSPVLWGYDLECPLLDYLKDSFL
jgi:hypothetical protein